MSIRTWIKEDGLFVSYCKNCNKKRKTKKRAYTENCAYCGPKLGGVNAIGKINYTSESRNQKISNGKSKWWKLQDKSILKEWFGDYINSNKHINMCKSNQKKATKAAIGIKKSKPEIEYENFLIKSGVEFINQYYVGSYPFDFYIPSKNLLIEIDGKFYHPLSLDECKYPIQLHNYYRDQKKTKVALDNGYKLKRIRI
jgi:very-short-patch-repair endonuclease